MTSRLDEALSALDFRYAEQPEDGTITVHTFTVEDGFTTRKFRNTEHDRTMIAEQYSGYTYDVWTRISTVKPTSDIGRQSRGTELDTYLCDCLHVDIDPKPEYL